LQRLRVNVAGIDVGASEHWVCGPEGEDGTAPVEVFGTTTPELERLADWLQAQGVESVAMESTSVYWIPVYELLESRGLEVVLVNARHLHGVPGRKTDMRDCQWLQLVHSCGLLNGSFRPAEAICRLRALQREQATLVAERTRVVQRMQKALDQMNVQVHRAVSDLTGKTGLAMVRAIVAGERRPAVLAEFRDPRCKKSAQEIAAYLTGTWREEHLFNLQMGLRLFDQLERLIAEYDAQLARWLTELQPPERRPQAVPAHPNAAKEKAIRARGDQPLRTALWRVAGVDLTRIDGISSGAAQLVLTEVGLDLATFPDEHHFVSWLRLSPKTAISGGKPLPKRPKGTGATRVAGVLRMAALSLRNSQTALGAALRRIARRKGGAVAIFATARKLAVLIYRMLRYGQDYVDQGAAAYEARFHRQRLSTLRSTALELGYHLVPVVDAA
jgi:transposase